MCWRASRTARVLWLVGILAAAAATTPAAVAANPEAIVTQNPATRVEGEAADDWQTYRNEEAGYAVDYPAGWRVTQRQEADGAVVTVFGPEHDGGAGISVQAAGPQGLSAAQLPNTRCHPVSTAQLAGTQCFDTIAFSTITTLTVPGRTYVIIARGRRSDPEIYQRFVSSFRLIA